MMLTWLLFPLDPCCLTRPHDQAYISRARLDSFSLTADMLYISSNAPRIARALFEIVLRKGWAGMTDIMITICKVRCLP